MNHKFEETLFKHGRLDRLAECKYVLESFRDYENNKLETPVKNCIAFCGIGDPDSFRKMLEVNQIETSKLIQYPDHYNYKIKDISEIIKAFKDNNSDFILTTQKDFVKLKYWNNKSRDYKTVLDFIQHYPVYYARINVEFIKDEDLLTNRISDILKD